MTPDLLKEYKIHCGVLDQYRDFMEDSPETRLEIRKFKQAIKKNLQAKGFIDPSIFPAQHRWNICSEKLRKGYFSDWDGWQFRSDWAMTYWFGDKLVIPKFDLKPVKREDGIAYMKPVSHLVVLGEQGIGDEICYASLLPELIIRVGAKSIEFQSYPRLKTIFERSFKIRCTDRRVLGQVTEGESVISLGDLLPLYRRDLSHFPRKAFLKTDPEKQKVWRRWLSQFPKPWVGYAYKSRHGYYRETDISNVIQGSKFDLQYDSDGQEKPPFDTRDDFETLYAFVSCLDKVVSCTQTLCHVSGSLGIETHAIIPPKNGEVQSKLWYYGEGKDSWEMPFYSNFTVYKGLNEFRNRRA